MTTFLLMGRRRVLTTTAGAAAGLLLGLTGTAAADARPVVADRATDFQAVVAWNRIALATSAASAFDPPRETRNLAIVQAAVLDAVVAATDRGTPYAVRVSRPARGSATAAVVAAAHDTLAGLYPDQAANLDHAQADAVAQLPASSATTDGLAIGRATAAAMVALRANDGSATEVPFTPGSGPGQWQPTPPAFRPALDPGWGRVTPFLLRSPGQFRPGPPPALDSPRYARDVAEVAVVGSSTSAVRTQDQTDTARFWVATAPQLWNQAVQQMVERRRLDVVESARAFALLGFAGADAFITAWHWKFTYTQWRPVTAIRTTDPSWTPLLVTPAFPDYPAAHAVYGGAAETVLTTLFGERPGPFHLTSATAPGVTHVYGDFHAVAREVADARVWGGVHWRSSVEAGRDLGRDVGRYASHHV